MYENPCAGAGVTAGPVSRVEFATINLVTNRNFASTLRIMQGVAGAGRFIIEFEADNIASARAKAVRLHELGVETDDEYGVVPIDSAFTHFVVRGQASRRVLEAVERELGARVFGDGPAAPL